MSIECLDNTIGVELGDNEITKIACIIPIYVPCEKFTVNHYGGMWELIKTKHKEVKQNIKRSTIRIITDAVKIPGSILIVPMVYYNSMYVLKIIKFIW